MNYRAIGLMSGSSLDGLDVVFVIFDEIAGKWTWEIEVAETIPYSAEWASRLRNAISLNARDYALLHADYGHFTGKALNGFIDRHQLHHRVQLIGSHGHTTFHEPALGMTGQIGDGSAIAAETGINVVSDLRAMDIALGGQGAPMVPIGEQKLFADYSLFLNIGGIANIAAHTGNSVIAYDVCPANRVLNMWAAKAGLEYDENGGLASKGTLRDEPLVKMNDQEYYRQSWPKSLANDFGTGVIFKILEDANLSVPDGLRTMTEHIAIQLTRSVGRLLMEMPDGPHKMLVTGGGAFNKFLIERLSRSLSPMGVEVIVPEPQTVAFKEALIMAFCAILRWREENTLLASVTGAKRDSIGGTVWIGQNA